VSRRACGRTSTPGRECKSRDAQHLLPANSEPARLRAVGTRFDLCRGQSFFSSAERHDDELIAN
jgi:hypothetical protein